MSGKKNTSKNDSSDKQALALRDLQARFAENKKCFECNQRGPTYVDTTIGSFVCSKCSGVLRGITPPHRIKSISMSSFSPEEIEQIRTRGNAYNAKVWLGLYDAKSRQASDLKDDDSIRELIVQKYEKKRFYIDPSNIKHTEEPELELPRSQAAVHSSPPSKLSSGLIGSTLQLHQQNKGQPGVIKSAATPHPVPAVVKLTPPSSGTLPPPVAAPSESNSSVLGFSSASANLSKISVAPPPQQNIIDPFAAFGKSESKSGVHDVFGSTKNESFANFDAATIYSTPADPLNAHLNQPAPSARINFAFPPMASPAPVPEAIHPKPVNPEAAKPAPKQVMSSSLQEDRYAALKDLDNIFKTSIELNTKPTAPEPAPAPITNGPVATHNPFASDFNATHQLNTSPWPLSASPAGSGFNAPTGGFGGNQNFFPSPWDAPSATSAGSAMSSNPNDFFSGKGLTNPWSENNDTNHQPFGQFGFNKKNPFL